MDSQSKAVESAKKYLAAATSVAATAMLARTIISAYLPDELRRLISSSVHKLVGHFYGEHVVIIRQNEGLLTNDLYDAAATYIRTRISPTSKRLQACKNRNKTNIIISLDDGECLTDIFEGVQYKWQLVRRQGGSNSLYAGSSPVEVRWLALSFHRKYKEVAVASYFPHILERSKEIKAADRELKLYMNELGKWSCVHLQHPATSETLAMEGELKKTIFDDLARFVNRKEYYKRIGKAWKRGYLLFGPPGTGKSSLIAAMANYLRFDIYDLDLKGITGNTNLKRLLIGMANKSMLVIEDIDCSINVQNRDDDESSETETQPRSKAVTLSGILNLIDGLWSANGEERIIVLTTNYRDRLDPALLRPGRMDMHIHMGYCGPNGFRMLTSNYHGIYEHPLFEEIEGLLKEVEATPAEIAEELMRSDDAGIALGSLILFLQNKRKVGGDQEYKGRGEDSHDDIQNGLVSEKIDREEKKVGSEITGGRKRKSRK